MFKGLIWGLVLGFWLSVCLGVGMVLGFMCFGLLMVGEAK